MGPIAQNMFVKISPGDFRYPAMVGQTLIVSLSSRNGVFTSRYDVNKLL